MQSRRHTVLVRFCSKPSLSSREHAPPLLVTSLTKPQSEMDNRRHTRDAANRFLVSRYVSTSFSASSIQALSASPSSCIMAGHNSVKRRYPLTTCASFFASSSLSCANVSFLCCPLFVAFFFSSKREAPPCALGVLELCSFPSVNWPSARRRFRASMTR